MKATKLLFCVGLAILVVGSCYRLRAQAGSAPDPLASAPASASAQKLNIVFILIDDLGDKDLGCTGSTYYETPHIDQLASQGMQFTNAYSCGAECAPSRASIVSGMYPPRHGVYTVGDANRGPITAQKLIPIPNDQQLDPKWKTLANMLDDGGYVTAAIGKWHLGNDPETGPVAHGFSLNIAGSDLGHPYSYFPPYRMVNLPDGPSGEYLTDRLTDESIKFIDANKDKPFFLYLAHYAVHTPLMAKPELVAKYKGKQGSKGQHNPVYAAMIDSVDQSVGRIMAELDTLQLSDHTVVIFTSDNGGVFGITSMKPLRGWKGMLYEGGVRVPFIVRWPGKVAPGSHCDVPIIGVDVLPTLADIAGTKPADTQPVDGLSLLPLLTGGTSLNRDAIFWHYPCYLPGPGIGHGLRMTPASAMRMGNYKFLEYFEDGHLEVYDLSTDIGEANNLAPTDADLTGKLHDRMLAWRKDVNAPVPTEPNPRYDPDAKPKKGGGGGGGEGGGGGGE